MYFRVWNVIKMKPWNPKKRSWNERKISEKIIKNEAKKEVNTMRKSGKKASENLPEMERKNGIFAGCFSCENVVKIWTNFRKVSMLYNKNQIILVQNKQRCGKQFVQSLHRIEISVINLFIIIYKYFLKFVDTLDGRWYNDNV